jgi:transposase
MDNLKLNAWQRRRLRRQLKDARDARLYRRTLAILEVDRGRSVHDLAASLDVEPRTIYYWIEAYLRGHDPAALADAERPGRPGLWAEGLGRRLRAAMALSPQDLGYPSVDRTVPLLRDYLDDQCGGRPSEDTIRRGLRRLGYVWKRPRYVLDPDPELEKKTADPPPDRAAAAPDRPPGRGRDRPAALPATAGRLGARG